jgi:hypothetical protein
MYIRTTGKPTKTQLKLCKEAVKFFGKKLLGETLYHKINLKIEFEKLDKKNAYAYCEWEFENHRSRDFILTIDNTLNTKQTLLALAHEMVHVKQYAKGELKDYLKVNKSKWKNEIHDLTEIDYWDCPWEIEAHGREKGLYVKFLEHLRALNTKFNK